MQDDDSWRALRGMRASNPLPIKPGSERGKVFNASLEQAEQFFKAARVMGYETRPVVLFYGLSQLGRAIAAAADSSLLETNDSWRLSGHGIKVPGLSEVARKGRLSELKVQDQGKGSFTQLAKILCSSSIPQPTPISLFWGALPETKGYSIGGENLPPVLAISDGVVEVAPAGDFGRPSVAVFTGHPEGIGDPNEFLRSYPALRQIVPSKNSGKWGEGVKHGRPGEIYMYRPRRIEYQKFSKLYGTLYRNRRYVFPGVPATGKSLHPILYWWPVLYSLSMLARYEPSGWGKMLDVDSNVDAVAIERVLDTSIEAIPEIAIATIGHVALSEDQRNAQRVELENECLAKEYLTFGEMFEKGYKKLKSWKPGGASK